MQQCVVPILQYTCVHYGGRPPAMTIQYLLMQDQWQPAHRTCRRDWTLHSGTTSADPMVIFVLSFPFNLTSRLLLIIAEFITAPCHQPPLPSLICK